MQVLSAFSIDTSSLGLLSRCAKCNGEFESRSVSQHPSGISFLRFHLCCTALDRYLRVNQPAVLAADRLLDLFQAAHS